MRFVQKVAHIIEGRSVVKMFRDNCPRCKYLNKKAVDFAVGQVPSKNLSVAPAFYISQLDIFWPSTRTQILIRGLPQKYGSLYFVAAPLEQLTLKLQRIIRQIHLS